ncbi:MULTISPECIES: hypothetical protein [unclassified Marinovum]
MTVNVALLAFAGILTAGAAISEVRIELNNVYPITEETFQLSDGVYYTQDNRGYFEVIEGPIEAGPARCLGSGFSFSNGQRTTEGICIFGAAEDTFTMRWKAGQQGEANAWTIVAGTGKYRGMTGEGIATTRVEIMYRAMPQRQSHIVGMVRFPPN